MQIETITLSGKEAFGVPPGRCIYCGSDGSPKGLTDEHIIALCLASDFYLPSASCDSCAKKTSYLEGYAGRRIFGPLRRHFGIQSRRRKIELGSVPIVFQRKHGEETRLIPREKLPATLLLPLWEPPGAFRNGVCTPLDECEVWRWREDGADEKMKALKLDGDIGLKVVSELRPIVFARMLAKIAHGMAVALLGIDSFKPYLPPLVLGEDSDAALLIGGADPPTEPLPRIANSSTNTHHHTIGLTIMSAAGKPDIIAVKIRLFLHLGSPAYWVIAGEPLAGAFERLARKPASAC